MLPLPTCSLCTRGRPPTDTLHTPPWFMSHLSRLMFLSPKTGCSRLALCTALHGHCLGMPRSTVIKLYQVRAEGTSKWFKKNNKKKQIWTQDRQESKDVLALCLNTGATVQLRDSVSSKQYFYCSDIDKQWIMKQTLIDVLLLEIERHISKTGERKSKRKTNTGSCCTRRGST